MAHTNLGKNTGEVLTAAEVNKALTEDGAGNMGFPDTGIEALPGLYPNGDTDTGLWSPGANTLAWSTGGSERMRIDSSGNVGIGTASPDGNLHVYQGNSTVATVAAVGDAIIIEHSGSTGFSILTPNTSAGYLIFGDPEDDDVGRILYDHSNTRMEFVTEGTSRVTIDGSGKVGIGTASPLTTLHLNTSDGPGIALTRETSIPNGAGLGSIQFGAIDPDVTKRDGAKIEGISEAAWTGASATKTGIAFYTTDTAASTLEKVRFAADGNVGIGRTDPQVLLHIEKDLNAEYAASTSTTWGLFRLSNPDLGATVPATGMIFISGGSAPGYASIVCKKSASNDGNLIFSTSNDAGVTFNEAMIIDEGGNVGIGETSLDGLLTLNQGAGDSYIFTFKSSDVAHGMTDIMETDTYCADLKFSGTAGGLQRRVATEASTAYEVLGMGATADTDDTSSSNACIHLRGSKKSSATITSLGATENVAVVKNYTSTIALWKGNGDLHVTNTTLVALDDENDIQLARNLQLASSGEGYKHKLSKQDFQKLVDVKAISSTGDFQIMQGVNAVSLGAISQLWNTLKAMAKELGFTDKQLLKFAKQY